MEMTRMEGLVEEYSDMIYRIAVHNVRNRAEAEDITQNVFLRLMERAPEFEDRDREKAWIIRVTLNLCRDHFRSSWFRRRADLTEGAAVAQGAPGEGGEVLEAVLALPLHYRNAVYLHYYEGLPVGRVAALLDTRESTVSSWLHRARGRLKTALKGEFGYDE